MARSGAHLNSVLVTEWWFSCPRRLRGKHKSSPSLITGLIISWRSHQLVSVWPVDCPDEWPILVNLDRVTKCPDELPNVTWLGARSWRKCRERRQQTPKTATKIVVTESRYELRCRTEVITHGCVSTRGGWCKDWIYWLCYGSNPDYVICCNHIMSSFCACVQRKLLIHNICIYKWI